eukprot:gene20123-22094_t
MRNIPSFDFVIEDSPECHQSMKYWNQRSKAVRHSISSLASSLGKYHSTGLSHKVSGDGLSDALADVAKAFSDDPVMEEPLNKFSDALSRIECYREMLLNQTNMLGMQPLNEIARYIKKAKEIKHQVSKANETLHSTWERFSNIPHQKSLQDPTSLDKAAHAMLAAKESYQLKLTQYIQVMREIHTVKKMVTLQKVLEHMLAQFSFFNFSNMVLKEIEPYMSEVFDSISKQLEQFEVQVKGDSISREEIEKAIYTTTKKEKKQFPEGSAGSTGSSTMHAINASTGRFFTKFGGMIASGVQGVRGKTSKDGPSKPHPEQEWEVVEDPSKKSLSLSSIQSKEDSTAIIKSAEELRSDAAKEKTKASQFYLSLDETGGNVVVKNAESTEESTLEGSQPSGEDKKIEKHHDQLDADESVVSLTELLEAEMKEENEAVARGRADSVDPSFKKGYLRIKKKGTLRNSFPLLYVILDKKKGNLLMQGDDEEEPNLLSSLMLSAVKECDPDEADRNFCFQVISATKEMTFQALSAHNMKEWMQAIQEGISSALMLSQERIRTIVRSKTQRDTKHTSQKKQYASDAAARIRAVDGNTKCADCSAPRPDWASINIGVVFCIECSGMHRGLGVHVSKVKSLTLDRWEEHYVKHMEEMGNAKVNSLLEGKLENMPKPTRESSKDERRRFITAKYVEKRFALPSATDEIDTGNDLDLDSNESEDGEEDDLFKEMEEEEDLFGSSIHSSIVCLVRGCKDCEKEKMDSSDKDTSDELVDSRQEPVSYDSENESESLNNEAVQTESTC